MYSVQMPVSVSPLLKIYYYIYNSKFILHIKHRRGCTLKTSEYIEYIEYIRRIVQAFFAKRPHVFLQTCRRSVYSVYSMYSGRNGSVRAKKIPTTL